MITQQDVKYLGAECMLRRSSLRSQLLLAVALACCAILSTQVMIRYMWTLPQFSHLALYNDQLEIKRFKSVLQLQLKRLQNIALITLSGMVLTQKRLPGINSGLKTTL